MVIFYAKITYISGLFGPTGVPFGGHWGTKGGLAGKKGPPARPGRGDAAPRGKFPQNGIFREGAGAPLLYTTPEKRNTVVPALHFCTLHQQRDAPVGGGSGRALRFCTLHRQRDVQGGRGGSSTFARYTGKGRAGKPMACPPGFYLARRGGQPSKNRQSMRATWARVACPRGERVFAPVPERMPSPTAQFKAWAA